MPNDPVVYKFMRARWVNLVVLTCLIGVAVTIVALHERDHSQFSPIDEIQHFDYVLKAPSTGLRIGERLGLESMRVAACRGVNWPGWEVGTPYLPECGDPQPDPSVLPWYGYNAAYLHTPVYYSATSLMGEVFLLLPGVDTPLRAYRLVGALWLGAGLVMVWYALGLVGATTMVRAAVVGLLGTSPAIIHASAFINPDATALLGGGLLLVALLRWESGQWPWWTVAAVSAIAVWLKHTNAIAVGVLVSYLAFRMWQQRDKQLLSPASSRRPERLFVASASALASITSILVWRLWQSSRQLAEERDLPIYLDQRFDSFQWRSLDEKLRAVVTPLKNPWIPDVLPRSALEPLSGIADVGLLVAMWGVVAITAAKSAYRALIFGVVAAMMGMGILTMITNFATLSRDPPVPARYGIAILPFAAVVLAPLLSRHVLARGLVGALACATATVMFYGVLHYSPKPVESPSETTDVVMERDKLIEEQESLLNFYRCQLGVDIHFVPGGCPSESSSPDFSPP